MFIGSDGLREPRGLNGNTTRCFENVAAGLTEFGVLFPPSIRSLKTRKCSNFLVDASRLIGIF